MQSKSKCCPTAFNIQNYGMSEKDQQNPAVWADQIAHRLALQSFIKYLLPKDPSEKYSQLRSKLDLDMQELLDNPLSAKKDFGLVDKNGKESQIGFTEFQKIVRDEHTQYVSPLCISEIFHILKVLQHGGYSQRPKFLFSPDEDQQKLNSTEESKCSQKCSIPVDQVYASLAPGFVEGPTEKFYYARHARVVVDRYAPKADIIKAFAEWLDQDRKQTRLDLPINKPKSLSQWFDNKVLPYADLLLWMEWNGTKISKEKMIEALLPPEKQFNSDPLRNTIRDYKLAMTYTTVLFLASVAVSSDRSNS